MASDKKCEQCAQKPFQFFDGFKIVLLSDASRPLKRKTKAIMDDPSVTLSKKISVFSENKEFHLMRSEVFDLNYSNQHISGPTCLDESIELSDSNIGFLIAFPNGLIVKHELKLRKSPTWEDYVTLFFYYSGKLTFSSEIVKSLRSASSTPELYDKFAQAEHIPGNEIVGLFGKIRISMCIPLKFVVFELAENFETAQFDASKYFNIFNY